jgi:hypothetical protein
MWLCVGCLSVQSVSMCESWLVSSEVPCNWQSVLALSPSVTSGQILAVVSYGIDVMGRLPWREDGSCLPYSTLYWSLCSTLHWSLLQLALFRVFFTWPSLESSLLDPLWRLLCSTLCGVFFTRPSPESSSLDPLLESSSLDPLWRLLCSTLCGVFFIQPSTRAF